MKILSTVTFFLIFCLTSFSQTSTDLTMQPRQKTVPSHASSVDSTFWKTENKSNNRFWGNSTYLSSSINFSENNELDFNIGRTNGISTYPEKGLGYYSISSWGVGYGLTNTITQTKETFKAFYEYNFFPFKFIGNFGLRGEYIYDMTDKRNYLRPSIGLTFVYIDVSYNYSFLLNGEDDESYNNIYKHGLSIRLKYFLNKKKWESNTFVRQSRQ